MKRSIISLFFIVVLASVIVLGVAYAFGVVIYPGEVGVRQIKIEPFQGFSQRGLRPGYHWSVPFVSEMYKVPVTVQTMHLHQHTGAKETEGVEGRVFPQLEVQTSDGSKVLMDLSVLYRYFAEPSEPTEPETTRHGGPSDLITQLGKSPERWAATLHQSVENELRRSLGALSSSQFYDPQLREEKLVAAQERINDRLRSFGIVIQGLLLRRYTYAEARIDNAIFQKNLQTQEGRLNAAASRLAEARARTETVAAEMDAQIITKKTEGDSEAQVLRSEGDLYEAQQKATADLAVARAVAEVDRLRAAALSQSKGAEVYVARELSVILRSLRGGVVSEIKPFDLESWASMLGASSGTDKTPTNEGTPAAQ